MKLMCMYSNDVAHSATRVKELSNKLFPYAGSKAKYLDAIVPCIDESKTLIEPFLGSGAVLLNSNNKIKFGSDLNSRIVDIFDGFKIATYNEYVEFMNRTAPKFVRNDKDAYYEFRNHYNALYDSLTSVERAFYQIICIRCCVNGMARWGNNGFNQGFGSRTYSQLNEFEFNTLKSALMFATFSHSSFFDLLHMDDKNVVWFLDPPYASDLVGSYIEEFDNTTSRKFVDSIKELTGDVIYTDTLNGNNVELLHDPKWDHTKLDLLWSTSTKIRTKNSTNFEYLFTNFKQKRNVMYALI